MRTDHNERVSIAEISGLGGSNVRECLLELEAIAEGTRTMNGFYVASLNPTGDEQLTPEQWAKAEDTFRRTMGLEAQPYFVVEHEKDGRTHRHIVVGRIDADSMTAIPADFNFQKHEIAARAIEQELGLTPVESVLVKDRESPRREKRQKDWEGFRDAEKGIDKETMKRELIALWREADSGPAFRAALEDAGYILARGDRRDFCIIDRVAEEHSLARCIDGAKTKDIRERMAEVDPASCPSVAEACQMARDAAKADNAGSPPPEAAAPPAATQGAADAPHYRAREQEPEPQSADSMKEEPPFEPGIGEDARSTPWGSAWRAFADRARAFMGQAAEQFGEYLRDEMSGTPEEERGPWVRMIGAGRRLITGWLHHDKDALYEAAEEAAKIAREEALRRLNEAHPLDGHHHSDPPPDEHHRDPARPGGNVEPPEPDEVPQAEGQTPMTALDAEALAWMSDDIPEEWTLTEDDYDESEPDAPERDGPDMEP